MSRIRTMAAVACAMLVLAACGDDNGNGVAAELEGLDGAALTVGSKQFSEQIILGQMMVIALEEAGAQVTDRTNLAGTSVLRESLAAGEIDMYWEYTGTAWADIFGEEEVIDDPDELLATVAERDEANGVVWGERAEFQNTYAIASNQAIADEYGVATLSDLAELSRTNQEAATLCIAEEFATRADGFLGMQDHYDMDIPVDQQLMDEGIIYSETADAPDSSCNFGMVFTTDGRIGALDLVVLEDDQAFFPEYNPAITVRSEIADEYPEVIELANDIISRIDFDRMRELNLRADEEGIPHEDVARDFLREEGFIS